MNTIDFIRMSLEMSKGWILGLAADIQDAPLTMPTASGGNHPLWILGHLAFSEGHLVSELCQGQPNPLADWEGVFKQGTQPQADASLYPPIDEVLGKLEDTRTATMAYLETISDEDLSKPSQAAGEEQEWFGTIGQCLAAVPIHFAFHGGQIADARRAAGRGVLMG